MEVLEGNMQGCTGDKQLPVIQYLPAGQQHWLAGANAVVEWAGAVGPTGVTGQSLSKRCCSSNATQLDL